MIRYLLDTNAVSDLVRRPDGPTAQRVGLVGSRSLCTSIIVSAEIRYGVAKRASIALTSAVDAVLGAIDIRPFVAPADEIYGVLRRRLEMAGDVLGGHDLLIAAHALALNCAVVTNNEREFRRIDGLVVENWLRG